MRPRTENAQVLIVEDDRLVALSIQNNLRTLGYSTAGAVDTGEEAVRLVLEVRPDLVLMDVKLAGRMDGITAAREIRAQLDVPVVFITAYADSETLERAKVSEPHGYILKPFGMNELRSAIELALFKHGIERALRDSEARYHGLFDRVPVGLYVTTPDGTIVDVNPALVEMLGYRDRDTLLAASAVDIYVHPEDRAREIEILAREGVVHDFVVQLRRRDGAIIWAQDNVRAIHERQEVSGYEGSLQDISELRLAERALQEYSRRLEEMVQERTKALEAAQEELVRREKLATMGHLAGLVSNELRNPLGVISNAAYLVQMKLGSKDEDTREYLRLIDDEVHNATQIVADLLDLGRVLNADREPVHLAALVRKALDARPRPANVEVTVAVAAGMPDAWVDARQVGRALANLIAFACHAMPNGGRLAIHAAQQGDQLALSIADTGRGIPPERMPTVFDPLSSQPGEVGLGLSIAWSLVAANGGTIEVESEVGRGTTFTVWLPARAPK